MTQASDEVLGLVPARGGSKGIPRKNIRPFLGKPLLAWTVDTARRCDQVARVVLSTEDEQIAQIGRQCGAEVPFLRPRELALDTTPTAPVVRHALDWLAREAGWRPAFVVVLEPTSPARPPRQIDQAIALLRAGRADSVASVSVVPHHFVPSKQLRMAPDGSITGRDGTPVRDMLHRRQDLPVSYAFNGLLFACRADLLWQDPPTLWGPRVLGQAVDARFTVDLDVLEDWDAAERRCRELMDARPVALR